MDNNAILGCIHQDLIRKSTSSHACLIITDIHVVKLETLAILGNDLLKINNPINIFLINLNIILYHS